MPFDLYPKAQSLGNGEELVHFQQRLCDLGKSSPSLSLIICLKTKQNKQNRQSLLFSPFHPTHPISLPPGNNGYWFGDRTAQIWRGEVKVCLSSPSSCIGSDSGAVYAERPFSRSPCFLSGSEESRKRHKKERSKPDPTDPRSNCLPFQTECTASRLKSVLCAHPMQQTSSQPPSLRWRRSPAL